MYWKKHVQVWFHFTRKERLGIYLLSSLIMLIWLLPSVFSSANDPLIPLQITAVEIDSLEKILIQREQLTPYRISDTGRRSKTVASKYHPVSSPVIVSRAVLDINTADSADLEQLPGIGEKLSARIIKYRDKLGGYIDVQQLKEIYGMTDSNYLKCKGQLKVSANFRPSKIQVNRADYASLRKHPYIHHLFAKSLTAYIKAHERMLDSEALFEIGSLSKEEILKVLPYLDFSY
jgi:competence ComEA-like helix-hairpin-helix protein